MQTMVPREEPRTSPTGELPTAPRALFEMWRRMLATLVLRASRTLRVILALLRGDTSSAAATPKACAITGYAAMIIGIVVWVCTAAISGTSWPSATATAIIATTWVLSRLFVMRIVARNTTAHPVSVSRAWAAGALPWVVAGIYPLRPVAWMIGFILTVRMLESGEAERSDAWLVAGIGFGFEIIGLVVVWLARNAVAAAFLLS